MKKSTNQIIGKMLKSMIQKRSQTKIERIVIN